MRLYDKVWSNADWMPPGLGVGQPLVKPKGIDDVPVMALTLWTDDPERGADDLAAVARSLESELKQVPGTRDVFTLGAAERALMVELDPARMAGHGLVVADLADALAAANLALHADARLDIDGVVPVTAGRFLVDRDDVAGLVLGLVGGRPLRLADVAHPRRQRRRRRMSGTARRLAPDRPAAAPAVTWRSPKARRQCCRHHAGGARTHRRPARRTHSAGIAVEVTRDYGRTASDKAQTLIHKFAFATGSVILLVPFALGRRGPWSSVRRSS